MDDKKKKPKSVVMPTTDGEPDMAAPGFKHGGKANRKKKHEHKVHGDKSKTRLDKKKRS